MRVNDLSRMELMSGEAACISEAGESMEPYLINSLPRWHSVLTKISATVRRAIATRSSSALRFLTLGILIRQQ